MNLFLGKLMGERQSLQQTQKQRNKRPASPSSTPDVAINPSHAYDEQSILQLQRTIGNQAVQQLISTSSSARSAKIQRAEIGLEQSESSDSFVGKGYAYWSNDANKDKSVSDYASHLIKLVNAELGKFGVPATKHDFRTTGDVGAFRKYEWTIYFNTDQLNENGATVGALSQKHAADIADTVYHEARHAEQAYRVARMLAGQGKSGDDIASELFIPAEVAEKALSDPLKDTKDTAEEFAEAKDWYNLLAGVHNEYKMKVNDFGDTSFEAYKAIKDLKANNFDTVKPKIAEFMTEVTDTRAPWLYGERERVQNMEDRSAMDNNILDHLDKMFKLSIKAIVAWDEGKAGKSEATLQGMKEPISDLWLETFNAYKDFEHEKDAWEVGAAAGKKFENKQPEPAK